MIAHERQKHAARFGAAIFLVQLIFWVVLEPGLFGRPDLSKVARFQTYDHEWARLSGLGESAFAAAEWTPIEGPGAYDCCAPGYRAYRYAFDLDEVDASGAALLFDMGGDNAEVAINDSLVVSRGSMELPTITYHANARAIEHIPSGVLREGRNDIVVTLVRDGIPYFDFGSPLIGPHEEVQEALAWRSFVLNELNQICVVAGFLIAVFAGVLAWQSNARGVPAALFALALLWSLRTHYFQWTEIPLHGNLRLGYYFLLSGLAPFAWLILADQWCGARRPRLLLGALIGAGVFALSLLICLWALPAPRGYDLAEQFLFYGGPVLAVLTVIRFGWHFATRVDDRYWEAAIFVLLAMLTGMELAFDRTGYFTMSQPFILGAFMIAFFSRNVRLFRSREQMTAELAAEVEVKEAELTRYFERETAMAKERTLLEERKRIMRDMHDGLGSRLFGIAAQLKAEKGDVSRQAGDGLLQVIDELRLIVDSLDTAGDDLGIALGAFRARIEPKMNAAGISMEWRLDDAAASAEFSAGEVLAVFRMLQEVSTNALRHSGATKFEVGLESDREDVVLTMRDDGCGFDVQAASGHGLRNLRARAGKMGAQFTLDSSASGTVATLRFADRLTVTP